MTVTLSQLASTQETADFFIHSQASHIRPDQPHRRGAEPDGQWWNPYGLFGLEDRTSVDPQDFYNLFFGLAPQDGSLHADTKVGTPLTSCANNPDRTAAFELEITADKSVSAPWAITHSSDEDLHHGIAQAHDGAARAALEFVITEYCECFAKRRTWRRPPNVLPKTIGAIFTHQASAADNPHLHTFCLIFNLAIDQTGPWQPIRFLHLQELTAAAYQLNLSTRLRRDHGLVMEAYGDKNQFMRIPGIPEELIALWTDPPPS